MGIASVLDKAGPALATGIVLALLTGAASAVMAWRDLASASSVRFSHIATELDRLRSDLENFRAPGGRFTRHDGDRHWDRMDQLDARIREQENRPPRLNPALDKAMETMSEIEHRLTIAEQRLGHIHEEQERLCQRLQSCKEGRR